MTKVEIREKNELIAVFMGGIPANKVVGNPIAFIFPEPFGFKVEYDEGGFIGAGPSSSWEVRELSYHEDWNWIMPVIRKINGLGKEYSLAIFKNYVSCTVEKGGKFYKDFSFSHAEYITSEQDDITAAFKLVVRFVEWYNVNVKAKEEIKTNE